MSAGVAARWTAASPRVSRSVDRRAPEAFDVESPNGVGHGWTLGLVACVGLLYASTAWELTGVWATDPNYSHGFFVPLLAAYFAWTAWRNLHEHGNGGIAQRGLWQPTVSRGEFAWGCCKIALGLVLHVAARFFGHLFLDVVSLVCVLRGLALTLAGREAHRELGFATLFLIFMARLPHGWHQAIAGGLQELASRGAAFCFESLSIPVFREGYRLHLPGHTLEVGEACSGLRQLMTCLALGAVVGYLFARRDAARWIVAAAALPVAVLANGARVVATGLLVREFGAEWGTGAAHSFEGVLTMAISAAALVGIARLVTTWSDSHDETRHAYGEPLAASPPGATDASSSATRSPPVNSTPVREPDVDAARLRRRRFGLALLLAAGGICQASLAYHVGWAAAQTPAELLVRLDELPARLGPWTGDERAIDPSLSELGDQRLLRVYRREGDGASVELWMVASRDGSDRHHHPEICMAAAGKPEDRSGRAALEVAGHPCPVQQYRFGQGAHRQLVYYWHYTLRPQSDNSLDPIQKLHQRVHQRYPSVTIEVFAPEGHDSDRERAQEFVRLVDAALRTQLPTTAVRGRQRAPIIVTR